MRSDSIPITFGGPSAGDGLAGFLPPTGADAFARAAIRAICHASVAPPVGERAFERCLRALAFGATARAAFRHPGKAQAIDTIWPERERLAAALASADDAFAFLDTLPWIGPATRRRLAAELGLAVDAPEPERAAA
jgi:hypothetical protein